MRRRDFLATLMGALSASLAPARAWARSPQSRGSERFVERWSWVMGQPVHLMVFAESEQHGLDACAAALAELRRVDAKLTLFDDGSDVCELNRRAGRASMRLDADLLAVLEYAEGFRRTTRGAFNVAIEPLMRAWGFHHPRQAPPTRPELEEAREAVAAAVIEVDRDRARLPSAHTRVDLGSIGVGYGIDRALGVLRRRGIRRAFCDISGDCAALDAPPGERGWLVEIADPDGGSAPIGQMRLRYSALATSANTESIVRYGALVAGHVLDPATGWPAGEVKQVSVATNAAVEADALSTAMFVRPSTRSPSVLRTWMVAQGR